MFSDVISAGTKALGGARFSLVSILPGTLLAAVLLFAYRSGAYDNAAVVDLTKIAPAQDGLASNAGAAVLLVFALFLSGVLLQPSRWRSSSTWRATGTAGRLVLFGLLPSRRTEGDSGPQSPATTPRRRTRRATTSRPSPTTPEH